MPPFIHSVMENESAVVAGTVYTHDLPVNPLSHLYLTLLYAQDESDTSNTTQNVLDMITKIEVLWKGSAMLSLNGNDLAAYMALILGKEPATGNWGSTDNDEKYFTFIMPFGRKLMNPMEAFPRSVRGELQLQITFAATFTAIDTVRLLIETVELPDATPKQFARITTYSATPAAVGEHDIEMPIGNDISDILLWGTSKHAADSDVVSIESVQILANNTRVFYSETNWEVLRSLMTYYTSPPTRYGLHTHQSPAAAYAQWQDTGTALYNFDWLGHNCVLPFDVNRDAMYAWHTAGLSSAIIRLDMGVADAIRVCPLEIIQAGRAF